MTPVPPASCLDGTSTCGISKYRPPINWPTERTGLHRTGTFKLVTKTGREFTVEDRLRAIELSDDSEFLKYLNLEKWCLNDSPATSFRPLWAIPKWSKKDRQYYSDDPAEGALVLDGELFSLGEPFDKKEAEYRRLRRTGLTYAEIAEQHGVALQTVKNHLAGFNPHSGDTPRLVDVARQSRRWIHAPELLAGW